MKGIVQRIVADRGFGFIKGEDDKDYFFHHSALREGDFMSLANERVEFEATNSSKGLRAENVVLD